MRGLKRLRCAQVSVADLRSSRTCAADTTNSASIQSPAAGSRWSSPNSPLRSEQRLHREESACSFTTQQRPRADIDARAAAGPMRARWSRRGHRCAGEPHRPLRVGPGAGKLQIPTRGRSRHEHRCGRRAAAGAGGPAPARPARRPGRRARRRHRGGLPGAAGAGLRRGGRAGRGHRAVDGRRRARRLRRARVLAAALGRPRVDDGDHDRGRHRTAGGGRRWPLRSAGRCARAAGRGHLPARTARAARVPGRPAVAAGARRLPHRHRPDHDLGPAREDHRCPRRRRHVRGRAAVVRGGHRPGAPAHAAARSGRAGVPAGGLEAVPARADPAARGAARGRGDGPADSGRARRAGRRLRAAGHPDTRSADGDDHRPHRPAAARHRRRDRGVLRQRAHRARLRHPQRPPARRRPGDARPGRGQRRRRAAAGLPGQQQRQPDRHRRLARQPQPALLDRHAAARRRGAVRRWPGARGVPDRGARRAGGVRRDYA